MFPENNFANFLEMLESLANKVVGFIFLGVRWWIYVPVLCKFMAVVDATLQF
jgi:hypothetical protein